MGTDAHTFNPYTTGQTVAPFLTVSGIGRGSGINGNAATNRYNSREWDSTSFDANKYFSFTLTPAEGYQLNLSSLDMTLQRSGTGPTSFAFRSSLDGFTSNIGSIELSSTSATSQSIDLSAVAYQGLTESITFRLFAFGASSAAGTFSVNEFTFNGTVSVIPEPHVYGLLAAGIVCAMVVTLRRRRVNS